MGMLGLLAKLDQIKDFLTEDVPDVLDWTSNMLKQLDSAVQEAAAFLRTFDLAKITGEEATKFEQEQQKLGQLESHFRTACAIKVRASTDPVSNVGIKAQAAGMAEKLTSYVLAKINSPAPKS